MSVKLDFTTAKNVQLAKEKLVELNNVLAEINNSHVKISVDVMSVHLLGHMHSRPIISLTFESITRL